MRTTSEMETLNLKNSPKNRETFTFVLMVSISVNGEGGCLERVRRWGAKARGANGIRYPGAWVRVSSEQKMRSIWSA